jgi:hypothetical protein
MTFKRSRRLALIAVAAAALALLATGWALATHFTGHVTSIGKAQVSQTNQSSNASRIQSSTTFANLDGTSTTVVVPAGQTRLVNARWVGETYVGGGGICYMRIGAIQGASFIEFNPVDSTQILLQSINNQVELGSQAAERSRILGAGTYTVVAQMKRGGANPNSCVVDDWHFAVQVIGT